MRLDTVESDVIHAIGYDADTDVLEIIFNNGSIYQYRAVPREVYEELMRAGSKGKYFQENVREEFDYWQWEPTTAQWVRAEAKLATAGQNAADAIGRRAPENPELTD
jgi:hypothetical protein